MNDQKSTEDKDQVSARYVALVHHPVVNKKKEIVTTSVTNLDIHDLSRTALTYGAKGYFIVTPLKAQHQLVSRLLGHWEKGVSEEYNPDRHRALQITQLVNSLEEAREVITQREGKAPVSVVTGANFESHDGGREEFQQKFSNRAPTLLIFGTGWGLASSVLDSADFKFEPILGGGHVGKERYNHLSVRAASAIICDRLWGEFV